MTALNGIVQGSAAYLLTDGAVYTSTGRVVWIGSKVLQLPAARMAIGWAGFCKLGDIDHPLADVGADQVAILARLPDIARSIVTRRRWFGLARPKPDQGLRLMVALCDAGSGEPQLWSMHSDSLIFGPRYQPYSLVRLSRHFDIRPGSEPSIFGRPFANGSDFDPETDGLRLLEHQRRDAWDDGQICVGGFAQLTTVDADGVRAKVLREWPDRVGRRIKPEVGQ